MNTNHTPAPWEARQSVNGYWFIDHEQGGEAYTLTKLDCDEPNARLIAAAPDLLAALREIHDAIASGNGDFSPSGDWFREAEAAIAKATGDAQ